MIGKAIYKLRYGEGFEWILPENESDFPLLRFDAKPRANSWKAVRMKRVKAREDGLPLVPSDFPACSGGDMLMIGRTAKDAIGPYLERHGEVLPLACDEGEFWAVNVTRVVDAFDAERSDVLRASDTGAILIIRKHVFRPAQLTNADVFKLPEAVRGLIYVSDTFVETVERAGLVGLEYVAVWEHQE